MSASQAYVIEAVTVLVGDGEAALDNARVTVRNGRIERVAKATGDPRRSISNTRSIVWVMQGGRLVSQGVPRP
jgi:uncharacterized protein (UPF0548 family)